MEDKTEKQLKKLINALNPESFTDEDFVKAFETVISFVQKTYDLTQKELVNLREMFNEAVNEAKSTNKETLETLKGRVLSQIDTEISNLRKENKKLSDSIQEKLDSVEDVKDADEERVIEEAKTRVLKEIPSPKELEPETRETLRDKLLPIAIEEVENLRRELDELKSRPVGRGGGTSAMAVAQAFKYIGKTEAPTGSINGSNTTYTVKSNIWWIAGFTLNGEQIAELPNFTYKGKTITFASALPSAYSGKDFEVKYIGT